MIIFFIVSLSLLYIKQSIYLAVLFVTLFTFLTVFYLQNLVYSLVLHL